MVFQTDYDKIKLLKNQLSRHFSDVIIITSSKNVIKLMSQDFSILGPSQSKLLATPVHGTDIVDRGYFSVFFLLPLPPGNFSAYALVCKHCPKLYHYVTFYFGSPF